MHKARLLKLLAVSAYLICAGARAQDNPHIVAPNPTPGLHPPDAPILPYHFVARPKAPNGQEFGNIASVALTPQGHLLVCNGRNGLRPV